MVQVTDLSNNESNTPRLNPGGTGTSGSPLRSCDPVHPHHRGPPGRE